MKYFVFTLSIMLIFASCQKDQAITQQPEENTVVPEEKNDYIVLFKEQNFAAMNSLVTESNYESSFDLFQNEYNKILAQSGVQAEATLQTYVKIMNGCSVTLKASDLPKIKSNKNVKAVYKDSVIVLNSLTAGMMCASETQEIIPCGVQAVGGGTPYKGSSRAFILDTGIATDHPDLRLSKNLQFSAFRYRSDNKAIDRHGHGTHVAGIVGAIANNGLGVVGVAPGVELVPVKVLDDSGAGSISGILAGIDYVNAKGRPGDVVNLSVGGGAMNILDNAVYDTSQKGIWFTIAAGNTGSDAAMVSPGRTNGAFVRTIGAMSCSGYYAFFSNYNINIVDYFAPGVGICSTSLNGGYASYSGTSMAAPHAAGIILLSDGFPGHCGTILCDRDNNYYKAICL